MAGIDRIAAERESQIEQWKPGHDDIHTRDELAYAASVLASPEPVFIQRTGRHHILFQRPEPWGGWDDQLRRWRSDRLRSLEIAGALIAAEIDRLERKAGSS